METLVVDTFINVTSYLPAWGDIVALSCTSKNLNQIIEPRVLTFLMKQRHEDLDCQAYRRWMRLHPGATLSLPRCVTIVQGFCERCAMEKIQNLDVVNNMFLCRTCIRAKNAAEIEGPERNRYNCMKMFSPYYYRCEKAFKAQRSRYPGHPMLCDMFTFCALFFVKLDPQTRKNVVMIKGTTLTNGIVESVPKYRRRWTQTVERETRLALCYMMQEHDTENNKKQQRYVLPVDKPSVYVLHLVAGGQMARALHEYTAERVLRYVYCNRRHGYPGPWVSMDLVRRQVIRYDDNTNQMIKVASATDHKLKLLCLVLHPRVRLQFGNNAPDFRFVPDVMQILKTTLEHDMDNWEAIPIATRMLSKFEHVVRTNGFALKLHMCSLQTCKICRWRPTNTFKAFRQTICDACCLFKHGSECRRPKGVE